MEETLPEKKTETKSEIPPSPNRKCPFYFTIKEDGELEDLKGEKSDLKETFGTDERELLATILSRGSQATNLGDQAMSMNVMGQAIAEYEPRNATETRLIIQAQALFNQGMRLIACSNSEDMIPQQSHCMKFAIQCLRLHNETVQALEKLRRGGEQKMIVQHVYVEGGQAAFMTGNFQAGGDPKEKMEG